MTEKTAENSVGIVTWHDYHFGTTEDTVLPLDCGKSLKDVVIRYETYGTLSPEKDNAILVEHALTGDAHLAGKHSPDDKKPGWWDDMVGPGKPFDTNRYFVVCSNIIGGCSGSTGPRSINPDTGKPYNMDFPVITIGDMVRAQKRLMDHLGISKWLAVAGGSMGGMLALRWAIDYPDAMHCVLAIATSPKISPQSIAFNWVAREAIMTDPMFRNGDYTEQPQRGLAIARMLAHITYLSDESMTAKFGRHLQDSKAYSFVFNKDFQIESYLNYQGTRFVERFDANSYLYITRAIDYFNISDAGDGDLTKALSVVKFPFLVVSFSSDWLFPPYQSRELVRSLLKNGSDVTYCDIKSSYGHDAFLLETETLGNLIDHFVRNRYEEVREAQA
ncbi:MAG: homoserine O-acetyltransferase [Lentisphaeria bacterium]|nr:homoserine O-acetyltransferase [Lentisphaeria bacterium]